MSVNNSVAINDAINYLNGIEINPKAPSITSDIKAQATSPLNGIFGYMNAKGALKDAYYSSAANQGKKASVKNLYNWIRQGTPGVSADKSVRTAEGFKAKFVENFMKDNPQKVAKGTKEFFKSGGKIARYFPNATKSINSGVARISAAKTAAKTAVKSTVRSAASNAVSKIPGASKLITRVAGSKAGKVFSKVFKGSGAGPMAAIEGGVELFTNVVPAFKKGGAKAGFKQIGKSALKVGASVGGWFVGAKAGAALGATIGSAFPGVGTVIGGVVGFLGGLLGSAICSGIANKITGKSEAEKIEEQEQKEQAQEIANDQASSQEIQQLVAQKVQEDINSGNVTEDTEKMAHYLQTGAFNSTATQPSFTGYDQYQTNNQVVTNWADIAQRISNGDTSVYAISDDQLNSTMGNNNLAFTGNTAATTTPNSVKDLYKSNSEPVNFYA